MESESDDDDDAEEGGDASEEAMDDGADTSEPEKPSEGVSSEGQVPGPSGAQPPKEAQTIAPTEKKADDSGELLLKHLGRHLLISCMTSS